MYYNPNYEFFAPQGWICPKCGRVYSPSTPVCFYCGGASQPTVTTTGTSVEDLEDKLRKQTTFSDYRSILSGTETNPTTYTIQI